MGKRGGRRKGQLLLDFTMNMWPIKISWTKTGDSVPLGILFNSLLIAIWQSMTAFSFQIGDILLLCAEEPLIVHQTHQRSGGKISQGFLNTRPSV